MQTNLHVDTGIHHPTSADDAEDEEGDVSSLFAFGLNTIGVPKTAPLAIVLANQAMIPRSWILLDNQSTVHIFNNHTFLKDITSVPTGERIRCFCNGGYQDTNQRGTLPGIGRVWYNAKSLANILSLFQLSKKFRITVDTAVDQAFYVHMKNGDKI